MNLCVPIPMLRPLPCSVNPGGGEPKENARSQAASSQAFKSFLPALPTSRSANSQDCTLALMFRGSLPCWGWGRGQSPS